MSLISNTDIDQIVLERLGNGEQVVIFVTGKYASGKSTTTNQLKEIFSSYGVYTIELDKVVRDYVQVGMNNEEITSGIAFKVYSGEGTSYNIQKFIFGTKKEIKKAISQNNNLILVEGALSSQSICLEIFGIRNLIILYFQPVDPDLHKERIISRIITDIEENTYTLPKYWGKTGKLNRQLLLEVFANNTYERKRKIVTELYSDKLDEIIEQYLVDSRTRAEEVKSNFINDKWIVSIKYT